MVAVKRYALLGACAVWSSGAAACIPDAAPMTGAAGADSPDGKPCTADGTIDDCEDNNNQVVLKKGRSGYWYTFRDKAGSTMTPPAGATFTMSPGGANGSAYAAHASGKIGGGQIAYAGMGFNFVDPKGSYTATAYRGISFWAKAASPTKVRVKVPDGDTDPDGKVCTECFNDFGADIDLTTTWTRYTLPFSTLTQLQGWGAPRPPAINPAKLYGVQWQVSAPGTSFDIWVDDVAFTGCAEGAK
jgi:endoglucanase